METGGVFKQSCVMCTKLFKKYSDLCRHILTQHTLERPYWCPHCKADFNDKGNLRDHIRTKHPKERTKRKRGGYDSGEGPTDEGPQQKHDVREYLCEIPYQDVSNSEGLTCTKPMAVDSPEKPFGCSKCSSRFKTKPYLTRHLRQVHKKA